jgi:hypothetical protein
VDWGLVMRLAGAVLLIAGFGLCISIVWAAIGFIAMAFGLICLLIAEEKTNRARKLASPGALQTQTLKTKALKTKASELEALKTQASKAQVSKAQASKAQASKTQASRAQASEVQTRDQQTSVSTPAMSGSPAANDSRPLSTEVDLAAANKFVWDTLCANDPDIARGVAMLAPYGKKYLDDFAGAYLIFNDKNFLPLILKHLVASARQDFGFEPIGEPDVGPGFEMPAVRAVAERAPLRPQAKRDRILRVVHRAEPTTPEPIPPRLAPDPMLISIERGRVAVSDPRNVPEAMQRQSAMIPRTDMGDKRAVAAVQPAEAPEASDDLIDELRRLKATSQNHVKTTVAPTTGATIAKTTAPSDSERRAVSGPEARATRLKVAASSPAMTPAKTNDDKLEWHAAVQQTAIEHKAGESIAIKSLDGAEKKPVLADELDDADNFRFLLDKLG